MSNNHRHVIIIAPKEDIHAQVVAKRLTALDAKPVIFDSSEFPERCYLSISFKDCRDFSFIFNYQDESVTPDSLAGVWWRRPKGFAPSELMTEPRFRRFAFDECRQAMEGWLMTLGRQVINPVAAEFAATRKLVQINAAIHAGFHVPVTLATNCSDEAKRFCDNKIEQRIFKPFTQPGPTLVPTLPMSRPDLENLDQVQHAPTIFQEKIKKSADVRINVIDNEIFPVLIRPRYQDSPLDWRMDRNHIYEFFEISNALKLSLRKFMEIMGLRFGAIDFALSNSGELIFLEINPSGQWLFCEIMTDVGISHAFAQALLDSHTIR